MCEFGWLFLVISSRLSRLGVALAYGARQTYRRRREIGLPRDQAKNDPERDRREAGRGGCWLLGLDALVWPPRLTSRQISSTLCMGRVRPPPSSSGDCDVNWRQYDI